jgi:hypothetical protein
MSGAPSGAFQKITISCFWHYYLKQEKFRNRSIKCEWQIKFTLLFSQNIWFGSTNTHHTPVFHQHTLGVPVEPEVELT